MFTINTLDQDFRMALRSQLLLRPFIHRATHRAVPTARLLPRCWSSMDVVDSIPHEVRTAADPRQNALHTVELARVIQINASIRLLRLNLAAPSTGKVIFLVSPLRLRNAHRLFKQYSPPSLSSLVSG